MGGSGGEEGGPMALLERVMGLERGLAFEGEQESLAEERIGGEGGRS